MSMFTFCLVKTYKVKYNLYIDILKGGRGVDILVCIKQVPATTKVKVDEKTGSLVRDGVESKLNPYDLYALETALKLREELGGSVTVITMGPPQAQAIIREAYMMGADYGCILSDRAFAGADVLATAYTLSQGIKALDRDFDLIICGRQTTDGDTAQVGPSIAEFLQIPHVTWVREIKAVDEHKIVVQQDMGDSYAIVELMYPCLITVDKDILEPRLPSYRLKLKTADRPIPMYSLANLEDKDEERYGLNGSATQVERIFPPQENVHQEIWEGTSEQLTSNIFNMLKDKKYI